MPDPHDRIMANPCYSELLLVGNCIFGNTAFLVESVGDRSSRFNECWV